MAESIGRYIGMLWSRIGGAGKAIFYASVAALLAMCMSSAPTAPKPQEQAYLAPPPPDPAIEAAKIKKEAAFQKTVLFATTVKKTMRDPDSLVWESIRANEDASVICLEFRARNGFGGMNREFAVYANAKGSQKPTAWNKHCTKPMNDMKHVRYALK